MDLCSRIKLQHGIKISFLKSSSNSCMKSVFVCERELSEDFSECDVLSLEID